MTYDLSVAVGSYISVYLRMFSINQSQYVIYLASWPSSELRLYVPYQFIYVLFTKKPIDIRF